MSRIVLLVTIFLCLGYVLANPCHSGDAQKSCGQCIKAHPDCAWCIDPNMQGMFRCDLKTAFTATSCPAESVYQPKAETLIGAQNNFPLDSPDPRDQGIIQMHPQQVIIRMKPGDVVEVPFHYKHKEQASVQEFVIQTSEFKSLGIDVQFSITCNGERIEGRHCPHVHDGETIEFFAKVALHECRNGGDIPVSIGVFGYNKISAIFVTPLCGCECEKRHLHQPRSPICYNRGDLICGVCACESGMGGNSCECDLRQYGVSAASDLDDQCRASENEPLCSGRGKCACGACHCTNSTTSGKFCECDSSSCPIANGRECNGQGECSCGKCVCEDGFAGPDCSCSDDQSSCTENGMVCSNNGVCECGKCVCNDGFTGHTCGVEESVGELNLDEEDEEKSSEEEPEDLTHEHEHDDEHQGDPGIGALPHEEATMTTEGQEENVTTSPETSGAPFFTVSFLILAAVALLR
ncbi:hypothetical protein QR680_015839 [Steinernema hermaphroditum]|uniref:Integrin beta subunit VWA domain-containing protein n=1 Tax=Steinernema hermaphroditum TaxID=289476 RepID=A0AA39H942_9BILA|nr:hypothetical protein QR680_015839 [Steinernema hermaphroditum]